MFIIFVNATHLQKEILENKIANIKLAGNTLYSQNDFIHSVRKYKKARRYIDYMLTATDLKFEFDKDKFNHIYLLCLLNSAAVYIKLGDFKEANILCNEVFTPILINTIKTIILFSMKICRP